MVNIIKGNKMIRLAVALRRIVVRALIVFFLIELTTYGWAAGPDAGPADEAARGRLAADLLSTVLALSQEIGVRDRAHARNLERAAEYIIRQFQGLGYGVEVQSYQAAGQEYHNIIAVPPVTSSGQEIIVVGAHYDSCVGPGADDNASGVAGMLALAGLLRDVPTQARLRFVAFVNEEPPFFKTPAMGSFVYASRMKEQAAPVRAALILDAIGYYTEQRNSQRYPPPLGLFYPNQGNFIAVVSNLSSRPVLKKTVAAFRAASSFPVESISAPAWVPGVDFSDHWSFWQQGYPAVMVTDTAFLRNQTYHQPTDLSGTLDYDRMAEVVWGLKSAILALAEGEGR